MKLRIVLLPILSLLLLFGCNKEEPVFDIKVTTASLSIESGQPIEFVIEGRSDFLTFYSGLEGAAFTDYPNGVSKVIDMSAPQPTFSHVFSHHGSTKATFVATSYGNWSNDIKEELIEFNFEIIDNVVDLDVATLKTPGIFGDEYFGVIDNDNSMVTVIIEEGTDISNLTTNLRTTSPRSSIFFDGAPFENKSSIDFAATGGSRSFIVKSLGGAEKTWTVTVVFE